MLKGPLYYLFYPHLCLGCGTDLLPVHNYLCLECYHSLPHTNFCFQEGNPVEKLFYGRIGISAAMCQFYFAQHSSIQNLIHEFKYRGNRGVAEFLGSMMGEDLRKSNRFEGIDVIVPLPLYKQRLQQRGYNQAELLCNGISKVLQVPVDSKSVVRQKNTESQTRKARIQRWENVSGGFVVQDTTTLQGKHVLLVDDVITTGATMEACGSAILAIPGVKLSLSLLAISMM